MIPSVQTRPCVHNVRVGIKPLEAKIKLMLFDEQVIFDARNAPLRHSSVSSDCRYVSRTGSDCIISPFSCIPTGETAWIENIPCASLRNPLCGNKL
jgi:hypothetical protein